MTVVHVLGARPNFPKAAPVIAALGDRDVDQYVIHTGQHYDSKLSEIFFDQLGIREPDINLGIGSGTHAVQTANVMVELEKVFMERNVDLAVVYGDVNSTVATALVASKLQIPMAHVEAGLRSFDRAMPEELNRLVVDALSDLLFTTSPDANTNLGNEGVDPDKVRFVGNPMIDSLMANLDRFDPEYAKKELDVEDDYLVATIHRPSNVDSPEQVQLVVSQLHSIADSRTVVVPIHPRGRESLLSAGLDLHDNVRVIDPLGYIEFMGLVRGSVGVVTDSGGVQEETTVLGIPCFTIRENTERPITITHGTNQLVKVEDVAAVVDVGLRDANSNGLVESIPPLWDGKAGVRIADEITSWLNEVRVLRTNTIG